MTYRELTRKLRRLACEFDRQARGDHEIWINPANHQRTTIPNWGRRDFPPGTLYAIIRDLGLTREDMERV